MALPGRRMRIQLLIRPMCSIAEPTTSYLTLQSTPTGLNMRNGTTGTAHENSTANPANVFNSGTYDFIFDTSVNTNGYDIAAVVTYSGWTDRAGQDHTVYYRQVGSANFVLLTSVKN